MFILKTFQQALFQFCEHFVDVGAEGERSLTSRPILVHSSSQNKQKVTKLLYYYKRSNLPNKQTAVMIHLCLFLASFSIQDSNYFSFSMQMIAKPWSIQNWYSNDVISWATQSLMLCLRQKTLWLVAGSKRMKRESSENTSHG